MKSETSVIQSLREFKSLVIGIGVTAFDRIALANLLPNYQIFCGEETTDLDYWRKVAHINSVGKRLNSYSILLEPKFTKLLKRNAWIWTYKPTKDIWKQCEALGLTVLGNSPHVREPFENKDLFFQIGRQIGLPMIPGEQWLLNDLRTQPYERLANRVGETFVIQRSDLELGGGRGTYFIHNHLEYDRILKEIDTRHSLVNLTKFIEGNSPSIVGCVTKHGVMVGNVQSQILDLPELSISKGTSGMFMGHDWCYGSYSKNIQEQATKIVKRLGEYMSSKGYIGIFGVDLMVDKAGKVYPVECNARYTGALPVYSMMQLANGEVPFEAYQTADFLKLDYQLHSQSMESKPKRGAHVVLTYPTRHQHYSVVQPVKPGVYLWKDHTFVWIREGGFYQDILNEDEFVYTDGCPPAGATVSVGQRLGKLIFKRGVLSAPHELNEFGHQAVCMMLNNLGIPNQ